MTVFDLRIEWRRVANLRNDEEIRPELGDAVEGEVVAHRTGRCLLVSTARLLIDAVVVEDVAELFEHPDEAYSFFFYVWLSTNRTS